MITEIEKKGMIFVGHSTDNKRMEIMELKGMFNSHSKPHMYCTATKTERIMTLLLTYLLQIIRIMLESSTILST